MQNWEGDLRPSKACSLDPWTSLIMSTKFRDLACSNLRLLNPGYLKAWGNTTFCESPTTLLQVHFCRSKTSNVKHEPPDIACSSPGPRGYSIVPVPSSEQMERPWRSSSEPTLPDRTATERSSSTRRSISRLFLLA